MLELVQTHTSTYLPVHASTHRHRREFEKQFKKTAYLLYLCDNQALLKAVKRWVGVGGKATFD